MSVVLGRPCGRCEIAHLPGAPRDRRRSPISEHGEVGDVRRRARGVARVARTTVRFHLEQLVVAGILTVESRRGAGAGRPSKIYAVEPGRLEVGETWEDAYRVLSNSRRGLASANAGTILTPEDAGRRGQTPCRSRRAQQPGNLPRRLAGQGRRNARPSQRPGLLARGRHRRPGTHRRDHPAQVPLPRPGAHTNPQVVCGVHRGRPAGPWSTPGEDDPDRERATLHRPDTCLARPHHRTPFHQNVTPSTAHPLDPRTHVRRDTGPTAR